MASILLLSGPNLNLLGEREPEIYGTDTLDDLVGDAAAAAEAHGHNLEHLQSNHEGELVDAIQAHATAASRSSSTRARSRTTRTRSPTRSPAFDGLKIELHLSNPSAREEWRHLGGRARRHRDGGRLRPPRVPPRGRGRGRRC